MTRALLTQSVQNPHLANNCQIIMPLPVRDPSSVLSSLFMLVRQFKEGKEAIQTAAADTGPGKDAPRRLHESRESQLIKRLWGQKRDTSSQRVLRLDPALHFPVEVLWEIFIYATTTLDLGCNSVYDDLDVTHNTSWVISHVSGLWRQIALTTPRLWSILSVDNSGHGAEWKVGRMKLLTLYLERSKAHLLHVAHTSDGGIDFFLCALQPHIPRLASLDLTLNYGDAMDSSSLLLSLSESELPYLRSLHLNIEGSCRFPRTFTRHTPQARSSRPFLDKALHLTDLMLYGASLSVLHVPMRGLVTFTGDIEETQDFYFLLEKGVCLQSATLTVTAPVIQERDPVWNTSLRNLSISSDINCLPFMRAPNLRSLILDSHSRASNHSLDCASFIASAVCLETLAIEIPMPNTIMNIMEVCSHSLTVFSARIDTREASNLYSMLLCDKNRYGPPVVPNLKELYVREDGMSENLLRSNDLTYWEPPFCGEHLIPMLASRSTHAEAQGVQCLQKLVLSAPYARSLLECTQLKGRCLQLAEFKKHGMDVVFHAGYVRSILEEDAFRFI